MRHKRSRGFKGITGVLKSIAYGCERYKLECKFDVCSPMQEYFNSNPEEEKEHYIEYGKALAKLNKNMVNTKKSRRA